MIQDILNHRYMSGLVGMLALVGSTPLSAQDQITDDTAPPAPACIITENISHYRVISDELVKLEMADASSILMRLKRHCPQLHFHKYMAFTPVNGRLCARFDDIVTRSGTPCRIQSFTIEPDPQPAQTSAAEQP